MYNCSLGLVHNFIFHLVAVLHDADFSVKLLRASGPNDPARRILKITGKLSEENMRVMSVIIHVGNDLCKEMSLPATEIALASLKRLSESEDIHLEDFVSETRSVHNAVMRELSSQYIYYYPPEKAAMLHKFGTDWSEAFAAMPPLESNVRAGIDCFAMGHNAACVFHLMRAMETGVQLFAKCVHVNIVKQNPGKKVRELTWEQILNDMTKPIDALPQHTLRQKRRAEKIKGAKTHLYGVKDVWRNSIMHPRDEGYNDLQTIDIINHVRAFLTELAGIVRRPGARS